MKVKEFVPSNNSTQTWLAGVAGHKYEVIFIGAGDTSGTAVYNIDVARLNAAATRSWLDSIPKAAGPFGQGRSYAGIVVLSGEALQGRISVTTGSPSARVTITYMDVEV